MISARALSRKRVLNPAKNNARDSPGRIARCFRRHENDLQNLRRTSAHRAHRRAIGGVCGESDAGVGVVLSRQKIAFEWCRLRHIALAVALLGRVRHLTGANAFLASDASSLMTGASIIIDGG
jgi:NAD(P)-dependent dehydrogenase (short-subunit alcohol dehydrogenase family)